MAKIQVDLVQYQALQFEMENMKEEIEELKEKRDFFEKKYDYYYCKYEELGTMIEDAKDKEVIIKNLKENQLTEESAIKYIYENSDKYEDWIEGSTIYNDLKEKLIEEVEWIGSENKELKKEIEELKKD